MSAYCTQADILGEIQLMDLIRLTDDKQLGTIGQTVLSQIISNASGEIDSLVGNVYPIPFNPTPASVNSMAITMACYRLYRRRNNPDEINNFARQYREIRAFLLQVQKGEAFLDESIERDVQQVSGNSRTSIFGSGNALCNSM